MSGKDESQSGISTGCLIALLATVVGGAMLLIVVAALALVGIRFMAQPPISPPIPPPRVLTPMPAPPVPTPLEPEAMKE